VKSPKTGLVQAQVRTNHGKLIAAQPTMIQRLRTTLIEIIREKIAEFKEPGFYAHGLQPKQPAQRIQTCPGCGQPGFLHRRLKWKHSFKQIETKVNYRMEGVEGWCRHSTRQEHQLWGHFAQPQVFGGDVIYDEEELENGQIIRVPRRISQVAKEG
jgi:hypothetical protein